MDELSKIVSQRAGVSEDQARKAVDAVAEFVKARATGLSGQVDHLLKGTSGGVGGLLGDLGGRFGSCVLMAAPVSPPALDNGPEIPDASSPVSPPAMECRP